MGNLTNTSDGNFTPFMAENRQLKRKAFYVILLANKKPICAQCGRKNAITMIWSRKSLDQ